MGSKLYVANLNYNSTAEDITEFFAEIGEVENVQLITDRDTGRSRGFAFVTMASEDAASSAIDTLNGQEMAGRPLVVKEARPREGGDKRSGGGGAGRNRSGGFNSDRSGPGSKGGGRGGASDWGGEDDWGRPKSGKKKGKPRGNDAGRRRKKGGSWKEWGEEDFGSF